MPDYDDIVTKEHIEAIKDLVGPIDVDSLTKVSGPGW